MARKAEATIPPNVHPRTLAKRRTGILMGFDFTEMEDGKYVIQKDGKVVSTQPTNEAMHQWIMEDNRKQVEEKRKQHVPSVAQALASQKADQVINRRGDIIKTSPHAPLPAVVDKSLPVSPGSHSEKAFENNPQLWGNVSDPTLGPNLAEGDFRMPTGEVVDVKDTIFAAHVDEGRADWIRFNGEGNQPTLISVGLYENVALPARDELGDLDQSLWKTDRYHPEPADPWQIQIRIPIVSTDTDGAVYLLTSRSPTALFAIRGLKRQYDRHPQKKKGLLPLITMSIDTYFNNKFGRDMYKPIYKITGWYKKTAAHQQQNLTRSRQDRQTKIPF